MDDWGELDSVELDSVEFDAVELPWTTHLRRMGGWLSE